MYASKQNLTSKDKLILALLFVIHWIVTIIANTYIFWRKSSRYDVVYFAIVICTIIGWILFKECIISLKEKRILYHNYTTGEDVTYHPSLFFYSKNVYIQNILFALITIFYTYNVVQMARIYNVPKWIIAAVVIATSVYLIYFRMVDYIRYKHNEYFKSAKVPEWLQKSPYLMSIYERKVNENIGIINFFNVVTCFVANKCETKQQTWSDFEEDVKELVNNIKNNSDAQHSSPYDFIVGIESGGAFVAKYVSMTMGNIPVRYVKTSKYDDGLLKKMQLQEKNLPHGEKDLSILRGKRILICDDQSLTGGTMNFVSTYLSETYSPAKIDTCTLYARQDTCNGNGAKVNFCGQKYLISKSAWGSAA